MTDCITSLVMKGLAYIPDAIVMAQSLRDAGTDCDYTCMVTPDVYKHKDEMALLEKVYDHLIEVPYLEREVAKMGSEKQSKIYGAWMDVAFTKLNILNDKLFAGYDRVLFVDADKYYMKPVDPIFEHVKAPAGVFSHYVAKPFTRNGMLNPYLINGDTPYLGDPLEYSMIDVGLKKAFVLMGSFMLFEPTPDTRKGVEKHMADRTPYMHPGCISMVDEMSFCDVFDRLHKSGKWPGKWHFIHQSYTNFVGNDNWLEDCDPKCYHYYRFKPRQMPREQAEIWPDLKPWWKLYDKLCKKWGIKSFIYENKMIPPEVLAKHSS